MINNIVRADSVALRVHRDDNVIRMSDQHRFVDPHISRYICHRADIPDGHTSHVELVAHVTVMRESAHPFRIDDDSPVARGDARLGNENPIHKRVNFEEEALGVRDEDEKVAKGQGMFFEARDTGQ